MCLQAAPAEGALQLLPSSKAVSSEGFSSCQREGDDAGGVGVMLSGRRKPGGSLADTHHCFGVCGRHGAVLLLSPGSQRGRLIFFVVITITVL